MTALAAKPNLRRFDRWFATTNQLRTSGTDILLAAAPRYRGESLRGAELHGLEQPPHRRPGEDRGRQARPAAAEVAAPETWRRSSDNRASGAAAPLDGIVLRYGNLYGPGASDSLVELIHKRRLPIVGAGTGVWSWTHLDDAAAAAVASPRGRRVRRLQHHRRRACSRFGVAALPGRGGWRQAPMRVPEWLATPIAGSVVVRWMTEGRGASNEKAKRELGWRPAWASWRDGFRAGLDDRPA